MDPTTTAIGTWSGGRFMHFGEPLRTRRLRALLAPGEGIDTVITADVYGAGEADRCWDVRSPAVERESYCVIGAIGHDFLQRASARARRAIRASPIRGCGRRASLREYIRGPRERSLKRLGPSASTCCCCTTPTHRLYERGGLGGDAPRPRAGLTRMLGSRLARPTASRST